MKIFIIHNWRQEYLKYTIKQILKFNDWKNVIFLTDDKNTTKKFLQENIVYENISEYSTSAKEFEKIYKHMSYNKKQYELFCFQRWLILDEYVKKHNIDVISHIDSDVLLFCNAEKYYNDNLKWYDFCYTGSCGHAFFGTQKWIKSFSSFLFNYYKTKIDELSLYLNWEKFCCVYRNNWYVYEDKTNCVTDMTLFDLFIKNNDSAIKKHDLGIIKKDSVFDNCIHMSEWFKYRFWIKIIKFKGELPYWTLKWDKKNKIKFLALHFQWASKKFMKFFYEKNLWLNFKKAFLPFWLRKTFFNILEVILKILHVYEPTRNLYLKYIRRWIDPTK